MGEVGWKESQRLAWRGQELEHKPRWLPRERRKSDWTVRELYTTRFPEPTWIVARLLPTGLATLAGRPKVGKSWMALQLAAAVACGGRFLDAGVQEGPVLFIALEDPPRRLKQRLEMLGVPEHAKLQFYTEWPVLNKEEDGLYDLQKCLAKSQPRLVVIDTLARAFDARVDWNAVGEATEALAALQRLAHAHDCCLLTVDHHRKPGPVADVIDDILGSTGKAAVIDTAWGLYKERSRSGATLKVVGRDLEERELALTFDGVRSCWQYVGEVDAPALTGAEQQVYQALEELGEADAGTLAEKLGKHRTTVGGTLRRLEGKGFVVSREIAASRGRGKQRLFYVPEEPSESSEPSDPTR